jgi:hypothetical protein
VFSLLTVASFVWCRYQMNQSQAKNRFSVAATGGAFDDRKYREQNPLYLFI